MIRLRLDYQRSMKPIPLIGTVLLLVAIAILMLTGAYYHRLTVKTADWEDSETKFEHKSDRQVMSSYQNGRGVFQDINQANEILRQLTLPWENLFHAVETSTDTEITLLGMEPDTEKHVVSISCEARNIAAMLNFIKRLEGQQEFSSVYLQSHQIQDHDPEKPVRFSIIALWRTAA